MGPRRRTTLAVTLLAALRAGCADLPPSHVDASTVDLSQASSLPDVAAPDLPTADRPAPQDLADVSAPDGAPDAATALDVPDGASLADAADVVDVSRVADLADLADLADVADVPPPDLGPMCGDASAPCDGRCVDLRADPAHCGACDVACGGDEECLDGACRARCAAGEVRCAGRCVDPRTDRANCDACGLQCRAPGVDLAACAAGRCAVGRCAEAFADCNLDPADGCEVDTRDDPRHCGACASPCVTPRGEARCAGGRCAVARCEAGWGDCDGDAANGCEASLASDAARCGACDRACAAGQVCSLGVCGSSCAAGLASCSGRCVPTARDPAHCGACGRTCALANVAQHACLTGACAPLACRAGFGDCDLVAANGCETALATSADHCGACGRGCRVANGAARCEAGQCRVASCAAGFADCDGRADNGCETDTRNDRAHCGGCDTVNAPRACHPDDRCAYGRCATTCAPEAADCAGRCVDTSTSAEHCGACGRACALPGAVSLCAAGRCAVARCAEGRGDCDRAAANGCEAELARDLAHCGACGRACAFAHAAARCVDGRCLRGDCAEGWADCDGDPLNGCEANLREDPAHCGACSVTGASRACEGGAVCAGGRCVTACDGATAACGGRCVDPRVDPAHCGGCARACGGSAGSLANVATYRCVDRGCAVASCAAGFGDCDGRGGNGCEVSLRTTLAHCGACGRRCAPANATGACAAGVCDIAACAAGFADCDARADNGCESDTRSDPAHCGACGRRCAEGQVCAAGVCAGACPAGAAACAGACRVVDVDPSHCGGCGVACPPAANAAPRCAGGFCGISCAEGFGNCDGRASNGCERALGTVDDCARCGDRCALPNAVARCTPARVCAVAACGEGWADCDGDPLNGCEARIADDPARCGGCAGRACAIGEACARGVCVATCATGEARCVDGARVWCADLASDPGNCGGCAIACVPRPFASAACVGRACALRCHPGRGDCDGDGDNGCEADTARDDAHCGACGRPCEAGARCVEGACRWSGSYRAAAPTMTAALRNACDLPGAQRLRFTPGNASVAALPLPFALRFWGETLAAGSPLTLGVNGYARPGAGHVARVSGIVPGGTPRGGILAAHWTDLTLRGSEACVASVGAAGDRTLVITWPDLGYFATVADARVEVELTWAERTGVIEVHFGRVQGARAGTAGLEHPDGVRAVRPLGCAERPGWNCVPTAGATYRFEPSE